MGTISDQLTDDAVLRELGDRLAGARLRAGLTQAELAEEAGVALSTVKRMEAGAAVGSDRLVRVMRALRLLPGLQQIVPPTGPSPLELADRREPTRRRARRTEPDRPDRPPWRWGDES